VGSCARVVAVRGAAACKSGRAAGEKQRLNQDGSRRTRDGDMGMDMNGGENKQLTAERFLSTSNWIGQGGESTMCMQIRLSLVPDGGKDKCAE
jgi:hypothetical protein